MGQFGEIVNLIGGMVATILLPLLGAFMFYDSKKRKAAAEARKAEADNITGYAAEWKELYDKSEEKRAKKDAKIESLYVQINEDRKRIRDLYEKNTQLELKCQMLEVLKCKRRNCGDREPPSDY